MPFFRLPGSLLGLRRHPDLGPVEFLASEEKSLLLVATSRQVFAISPEATTAFLQDLQHAIELGSLSPALPQSVYPSFVVAQAWDSALARYLWLAGFFVNIGLLAWVSLMAPALGHVSLGFLASGAARPPSPGLALILLPVVSLLFYLAGWGAGLMIYRTEARRPMAFILWTSGLVSSLLFLLAVHFIEKSNASNYSWVSLRCRDCVCCPAHPQSQPFGRLGRLARGDGYIWAGRLAVGRAPAGFLRLFQPPHPHLRQTQSLHEREIR
jgi:hypothetical protein